jgi:signal transduction histidine kinase
LSIGLERLGRTLRSDIRSFTQISELRRITQDIASDVHRLSHQLHSTKLEHLGLVPAIKGLCREMTEQHGAQFDFIYDNLPASIAKSPALCLFRVTQEAMSNTIKHSGGKKGRIELFADRRTLHLCVSDSGIGFDVHSEIAKGHLGLVSMQERVRAAGGTISIESRRSRGTRIAVHLAV